MKTRTNNSRTKHYLSFITLTILVMVSLSASAQRVSNVTVVKSVPKRSSVVIHSGINYRYYNGNLYHVAALF